MENQWGCLADAGNAIGASRSGSLLGLLHRRERDSRIFTNSEIIFDDFGSKDTLLLNNRGQTFVSLRGVLEILSKTELSSDKVDDFQEEIFGRVLPQLAFEEKRSRWMCRPSASNGSLSNGSQTPKITCTT